MTTSASTSPLPDAGSETWQVARESFRYRCARFWLNRLFLVSQHSPRFMRASKFLWCWGCWTFSRAVYRNTMLNARRILGPTASDEQRAQLARSVISNFYDVVYDICRTTGRSLAELQQQIVAVEGQPHYDAARKLRRGAIIATAHLGSFEVGIASLRQHEPKVHVIFQRDRLAAFEDVRRRLHEHLGVIDAPAEGGWETWMQLRDALTRDEVVLMQADRVMPGQRGEPVPFFTGHVEFPLGPIKLARLTGSPIIPVFAVRTKGGVKIVIEPAIHVDGDDRSALLALAAEIEKQVKAHPEQWLALHRPWLEDQGAGR